jgi:CRP-like cAMP-binding protein
MSYDKIGLETPKPNLRRKKGSRNAAPSTFGEEALNDTLAKSSDVSEPLARKLSAYVPLTLEDKRIIRDLASETRHIGRRYNLVIEGVTARAVFLLGDGIMMRYRTLRDGRRQILNLIVPGDFAGVPGCFFESALYSIKALTNSTVGVIPIPDLHGLFVTHPQLAAKIFWSFSCDAAIYAEHLVVIGRRTALERVAHFLLELLTRLQVIGFADQSSYLLPLKQEMIADALGLSQPYLNRVIRQLTEAGLVTLRGEKVVISDVDELSALADFDRGYLQPLSIPQFATRLGAVGAGTDCKLSVNSPPP